MHVALTAPKASVAYLVALSCFFAGCGHGRAPINHGAGAHRPQTEAATPAASEGLAAGRVLAMGPTGLVLPVFLHPQTPDAHSFGVAAARALRRVYEEDDDDASALLALAHRLDLEMAQRDAARLPERSLWQQAWQPILGAGLARAAQLQAYAPGLRALRVAYKDVYLDDTSGALRNLAMGSCHAALQQLHDLHETDPNLVLTVEPLGPKTLTALLLPCRG